MNTTMPQQNKGLNILCIDGGGARGLSSLIVLREMMHRINYKRKEGEGVLEPYDHFDIIAGAGTGGVSACLLGRLRMPIKEAIEEYAKLMEKVFSEKKITGPTMYKGTTLQEALKAMVRGVTGKEDTMMTEAQDNSKCKNAIFAMARHNINPALPVMFRSYTVSSNPGPDCAIWQALYATMAQPGLFKSIEITDSSIPQSFVSSDLGCSNPLVHVLSEANQIYPDGKVACIISLGAGHSRTIQIPDSSWRRLVFRTQDVVTMKEMARDGEQVAEDMARRFQNASGIYFRFNVDQGMQEMKDGSWERLGETMQHTNIYLQKNETNRKMENAVCASEDKRGMVTTAQAAGQAPKIIDPETQSIPGATRQTARLKGCPAPTVVYTGREEESNNLIGCIMGSKEERRIAVVYGLGGVGKTQLVLNVVEKTSEEWDFVIFVDASSRETVEETLKEFAKVKGVGDTYNDTIEWLESCRERWIMILDNADTPSTNVRQYIPGGRHGGVLITTRLPDLVALAKGPDSACELSRMSDADSLALFMKIVRLEGGYLSEEEMISAKELLKDFGHLALAIVQAGAYIAHSPGMTFTKYQTLFLSQRRRMLEQYNQLPALAKLDDYGETVYTTWRMCYDQLKPQSRQILWLVSYLHYAHVSEDIFKWAAQQMNSYEDPLPLNQLESSAHSHVKDCLSSFLDSDGRWDTVKFTNVMADLRSYSLVTFDQLNLTYVVHVLVQDWARTMIPQETELAFECTVTLVSFSIRWEKDTESLAFKRGLGPHVTRLLEHRSIIGANHARRFSAVCYSTGQWSQKEKLELLVLETFKQRLGEKHPATLVVMGDLGSTYSYQKQWKKAENYAAQALDATKEVLGEEHTETLRGMEALAIIYMYSDLDKWNEAERLLIRALDAHRRILSEDHPDTLNTMANLAHAHSRTGQWSEAEKLRSQVVKGRKQVLGEEHPKTLSSMLGLAQVYSHMDRWDEATSLLTTTLNISRLQLGDEHPHTQRCARHLAKVKIHQPV